MRECQIKARRAPSGSYARSEGARQARSDSAVRSPSGLLEDRPHERLLQFLLLALVQLAREVAVPRDERDVKEAADYAENQVERHRDPAPPDLLLRPARTWRVAEGYPPPAALQAQNTAPPMAPRTP